MSSVVSGLPPAGAGARTAAVVAARHAPAPAPDPEVEAALRTGDPLGEAAAAALSADPALRAQVSLGLRSGLAAVADPHPAVAALLAELEAACDAVDDELLDRGSLPYFTIPFPAHIYDLGAGALIRSYAPPEPAAVLVGTGELVERAYQRLLDTAHWINLCMLPGGLRRGAPGYVATAEVRLLHARIRNGLARARPQAQVLPLHQVDLARTWLDFTLVTIEAAATIGMDLTDEEQRTLYRFWQHLGRLLGIGHRADPGLLRGVLDGCTASRLERRVAAVTGPPSEDSRRLTEVGLGAIAQALHDLGYVPLWAAGQLVHTVSRRMQGEELADALGVRRHRTALAVAPVAVAAMRWQRRALRRVPPLWSAVLRVNVLVARWHAKGRRDATGYEHG
ncbi:oxygenase MpaB family protein [Kineococcus rubinsiae]|uniref:oxygenase MpaB family protein n=1 Tax=Kineococcus rubinsiae TaxID=2609562 RepID=UPI00142F61AE|nr:oxygenase MpaB family protein [Kineococcus rubinsiae]NIZ91528.1 DUF2236 domain-containing protein [Kineococcus rubinsiae]